jgi:hypothetical protein
MLKVQMKKERQMRILLTIDRLGFATRTHIQELHNLSSPRNTNRVLSNMGEYLNHYRVDGEGERVYYLNQLGRDMIGSEREMKKTLQIHHYLMRGDMYVYLNKPNDWVIEKNFEFSGKIKGESGGIGIKKFTIIPDAECIIEEVKHYIEVDYARVMKENKKKMEMYSILRDTYTKAGRKMFKLIFYTSSEVRKEKLKEWGKEYDIHASIYTKKDIL